MKKQFAVIGLGRFGKSMVRELSRIGHEVLAIDIDPNRQTRSPTMPSTPYRPTRWTSRP